MDEFRFDIPLDDIDVEKAEDTDEDQVPRRIIKGYASTAAKDGEEESVLQHGLDLSYLKERGFINYDHQRHMILGWPLEASVDKKGVRFKGELITGMPMADLMWNTAIALKKSRAPRKLGLSIEGKVLERDGKVIKKARVFNVAVTPHPVNPVATFEALTKAFSPCSCQGECCKDDLLRALTAGHATALEDQKDGDALRVESIDSALKVVTAKPSARARRKLKGRAKQIRDELAARKSLSFDDTVLFLQLSSGLSWDAATAVAQKLACQEAA